MAHIEELRPQHRSAGAGMVDGRRLFDWTACVVPAAVICTVLWICFLFWAAFQAVQLALA